MYELEMILYFLISLCSSFKYFDLNNLEVEVFYNVKLPQEFLHFVFNNELIFLY
jgi:hypothetical protein